MKLLTLLNSLNSDNGEANRICIYMRGSRGTKCSNIDCVNCPLDGDDNEKHHILRILPHDAPGTAD